MTLLDALGVCLGGKRGCCPVCVLLLDSQEVSALTLTVPRTRSFPCGHSSLTCLPVTGGSMVGMF